MEVLQGYGEPMLFPPSAFTSCFIEDLQEILVLLVILSGFVTLS